VFPRAGDAVLLAGELDLAVDPALRESVHAALAERGSNVVILDLAGVSFMDAHALGTLLELHDEARAAGRDLHLRNVPAPVRRLLHLTGCTSLTVDG